MAYDAFISYSHGADANLAPALHSALHRLIAWNETSGDFDWAVTTTLPRILAGVFKPDTLWIDLSFMRSGAQGSAAELVSRVRS